MSVRRRARGFHRFRGTTTRADWNINSRLGWSPALWAQGTRAQQVRHAVGMRSVCF
jgi:hypothetical protein